MIQSVRGPHRLVALLVPWVFLAIFLTLFLSVLWPRMLAGSGLATVLGAIAVLVFVSFLAAAVTFSRDVLLRRYP